MTNNSSIFAYVGAYTTAPFKGHGEGLSVFQLDPTGQEWRLVQVVKEMIDPSFLALDGQNRFLYCVHESLAEISAFSIDPQTGHLTWLNTVSTGGSTPASLMVAPDNRYVIVANYMAGTVAVLPTGPDGKLGTVSQLTTLEGQAGPDKTEQTMSHPHDIRFDPTGQYIFVPDKGFDRLFIFSYNPENGNLTPASLPALTEQAGAGPRHLVFHPDGRYAYLINELNSTVTTFSYGSDPLNLAQLQVVSTLPPGFTGSNTCAEIQVAPSGKFLYGSNRGHDSIVVYAIDQATGQLTPVQWEPTGGKTPRFFKLDNTGTLLYAANQDSDNITIFKVDPAHGTLSQTGQVVQTGSPVCIVEVTV